MRLAEGNPGVYADGEALSQEPEPLPRATLSGPERMNQSYAYPVGV
jgi:hypothetical protein